MRKKFLTDRKLPDADQIKRYQNFDQINKDYLLIKKSLYKGNYFWAKTLGIIGMGTAIVISVLYLNKPATDKLPQPAAATIENKPIALADVHKSEATMDNTSSGSKSEKIADTVQIPVKHVEVRLIKREQALGSENEMVKKEGSQAVDLIADTLKLSPKINVHKAEEEHVNKAHHHDTAAKLPKMASQPVKRSINSDTIIYNTSTVEVLPEFPGGHGALLKFLSEHLKYPETEKIHNPQGKTFVSFIIDKTGSVRQVEVARGIAQGEGLDKEAVRVVKMMPRWKPGKQNGKPVPVKYMLPVEFKVQMNN